MPILVLDPTAEARVRRLWPGVDDDRWTEVWEGVTVMSPLANNEHQKLATRLSRVIGDVIEGATQHAAQFGRQSICALI